MTRVVRTETRRRGIFGKLIKFLFIAFNILMIIWVISYWVQVSPQINNASSEAVKTGAAIGTTLGTTFILFFWAAGDLILGMFVLFTRGKTIITEETQ